MKFLVDILLKFYSVTNNTTFIQGFSQVKFLD